MKFIVDQKVLNPHLSFLSQAVPQKNVMSVLSTILFDVKEGVLYMKASDLVNTRFANCEVRAEEDFSCCVEAKPLIDVVSRLSGSIEFTLDNNRIILSYLGGESEIPIQGHEFPLEDKKGVELVMNFNKDFLNKVSGVSSLILRDEGRPYLEGVRVDCEEQKLVVLHPFRMSYVKFDADIKVKKNITLSRALVSGIKGLTGDSLQLFASDSLIGVYSENRAILGRRLEDQFPNYMPIFNMELTNKITYDVDELKRAIGLAKACTTLIPSIGVTISASKTEIVGVDMERGTKGSQVVDSGAEYGLESAFNADYFLEALNKYQDEVTIEYLDGKTAIRLGYGTEMITVVMPIII